MEDILKQLISIVAEWNFGWQIFGIILILYVAAFARSEDVRRFTFAIFGNIFKNQIDKPINHPFFVKNALMKLQISKIHFDSKDRTWLFKTLLKIKFDTAFQLLEAFVKGKEWKKLNKYELQSHLLFLVNNIIETYEMKIEAEYEKKYLNQGKKIFELVYNSDQGFKNYHNRNVENIQNNIAKMFEIVHYNNCEIMNSFILQIWVALDTAINDCVIAFKNLNGELKQQIELFYK